MLTGIVIFGTLLLTQVVKKYIQPKFGATGVHVFIFGVAAIYTLICAIAAQEPSFMEFLQKALSFLAATIASYEILLKKITS